MSQKKLDANIFTTYVADQWATRMKLLFAYVHQLKNVPPPVLNMWSEESGDHGVCLDWLTEMSLVQLAVHWDNPKEVVLTAHIPLYCSTVQTDPNVTDIQRYLDVLYAGVT